MHRDVFPRETQQGTTDAKTRRTALPASSPCSCISFKFCTYIFLFLVWKQVQDRQIADRPKSAMQRLKREGQKEIKTEKQDSDGSEKGDKPEEGETDIHVTQVGTSTELLAGMAPKPIKQEPEEGLQPCWEAQWQEFLKTMQAPCLGWRPSQLSLLHSGEGPKEFRASSWPRRESATPILPSLPREALQKTYESSPDPPARVKEEIMEEEEPIGLETRCQCFRRFCYWEAEGPREVCRRLQGLCRQWLKPERHSKEQILELVTLEQFLAVLPQEMQNWVREGCPQTCAQAVALAEDFLLRQERREEPFQELEPFEQVIVNSPKAEQDPSDTEELQLPIAVEQDSDGETNLLSDGQLSENEEENYQLERHEQAEASWVPREKARGEFTPDSLFVSGTETKEKNLHVEIPKEVELSEISLEKGRGALFQVSEGPASWQGVKKLQEDPLGSTLRKGFECREEDALRFNKKPSQERIPDEMPEKAECRKGFAQSPDISHPEKAPSYECSYCGKKWPCQSQLRRHVKIHTGERPHKCTDCGKSFSTSSNLSQHKRVHTGERPYSCKDCGKSYRRRASLLQHERETCRKGNHLNAPAMGYVVLGNCTLLCMKKSAQGGRNRVIAPKGGEAPLAPQPLNTLVGYVPERSHPNDYGRGRLAEEEPGGGWLLSPAWSLLPGGAFPNPPIKSALSLCIYFCKKNKEEEKKSGWGKAAHTRRTSAMQSLPGSAQGTKMEEHDSAQPGEKSEAGGPAPHDIQIRTVREFWTGVPPGAMGEPLWQELLKMMQSPNFGLRNPHLMEESSLWNDAAVFHPSFKRAADAGQWPRGEQAPDPGGGLPEAYMSPEASGKVKEEIPDEEDLEARCRHFRQFRYREAETPRENGRQLLEVCRQWLRPEGHTKEQMLELVVLEQFLTILPLAMQSWVQERSPENMSQAMALAEGFPPLSEEWEQKPPGPLKEDPVDFPLSEQSPSDPHQILQGEAKQEETGAACLLAGDQQVREDEVETFQLAKGPKQRELNGILLDGATGNISQGPNTQETFGNQQVRENPFGGRNSPEATSFERETEGPNRREGHSQSSDLPKRRLARRQKKVHVCSECGKTFDRLSVLANHLTIHTGEKPYQCVDCGKGFGYKALLVRHSRSHEGQKPYKCLACGKMFSTSTILSDHERIHTGERPFTCADCGKCFVKRGHLMRHQLTHTGEKRYKCSECDKCFGDKSLLTTHKRSHTGEKPYTCAECGKSFSQGSHLITHKRIHTGERPHQCSHCGKSFSRRYDLLIHERTHTGEKPYPCPECGKSFRQSSQLFVHGRIHMGGKPYRCAECGKSFRWESSIKMHMKNHAGDRPYACSECGKRYGRSSHLIRHKATHTGEKPFQCSQCKKSFTQRSMLDLHERTHTGERPFQCLECGKCFRWESNYQMHAKNHTRKKPFECTECSESYDKESQLIKHQRIHTGEKPFKCKECGLCFDSISALTGHRKAHRSERPFKCADCGRSYNEEPELLKHQRAHTAGKPHKCLDCDKSFDSRSALRVHRRMHTGEKPYKCSGCGKNFSQSSNLRTHMRIHTGENV
nr:uncharacterized protein LOC118081515 [Zootoca vivipara]